jgi:sugar porter (SP) family MFS transporter
VTGGYLTIESFNKQFPPFFVSAETSLTQSVLSGFTIAIWNLGCFCSAILAVFIGDLLGRRNMVFGGLAFLVIGEIIQCSSFQWGQLLAGRFISGFGLGFNCATIPAWQAECTKAYRRGTVLMISAGAMIAGGMAFAYWVSFGFRFLDPNTASWRVPIGLQIIWAVLAFVTMLFMPESPRWLILQGREGEALEVLSALNDLDIDDNQIHQEFLQIKDAVIVMSQGTFSDIFRMGDYRDGHRVILAVVLQFCQQICGINFMTQYFGTMFTNQYQWMPPYHPTWNASILAAGAGTFFFLASFISVFLIDRVTGRRGLMLFGTTGMLISMIVLTVMLWKNDRASLDAGTAFVFIYTSCYAMGWQGMSWIYQVEIVPLRIRGPANALSTASNWLANFIITLIGPVAFAALTWKSYLIFVST